AAANDPVKLRADAVSQFTEYLNGYAFNVIDSATRTSWINDLKNAVSTLTTSSDISNAKLNAQIAASNELQKITTAQNQATLADYKTAKIAQLTSYLNGLATLSDEQKQTLISEGTDAINAVALNVYGDIDQAKTDVDSAYSDTISKISGLTLKNQFPITVDETTFPDENLRNEVLYQMQVANGGIATNKMSYDFAGSFTSLELPSSLNIENFKGLQYFYNLESIDISGSNVSDWSPLETLPKLQNITADVLGPDVSNIDVSNFPALTRLQVSGVKFTQDQAGNQLSGGTGITKITTGPTMTKLLVDRLPALEALDTSASVNLQYLSASNMEGLKNLDLSQNTYLTELYAYDDPNLAGLDLSNQYNLQTLAAFGDNLTNDTLNWGYIGGSLTTVSLANNPELSTLPTSLYSLQNLSINKTNITNIQDQVRSAGWNLIQISASDIPGFQFPDLTNNPNLEGVSVANDGLTTLNLMKPVYETDEYGYTKYDENYNPIPKLDANGNPVMEPMTPHLQSAIFSNNNLTEVDLSGLPYLSTIQGDHNQLTSINTSGDTRLSVLILNDNQLSQIDLSDNTLLSGYMLGNNHLTTLDLTGNIATNHQYGDSSYQTVNGSSYEVDGQYYVNLSDIVGKENLGFVSIPGADTTAATLFIDSNTWSFDTATGIAKYLGTGVPTQIQYNFSAGAGQFMPVVVNLSSTTDKTFNVKFAVTQKDQGNVSEDAQTVKLNESVTEVPTPVANEGFVFDHWENSNGLTVDPATFHVSKDDTFYAIFRDANAATPIAEEPETTQILSTTVNADGSVTITGKTNLATNQIATADGDPLKVNKDATFTYVVSADKNTGSMTFVTSNYTGTRSKEVTVTWENPTPVVPTLTNLDLNLHSATLQAKSYLHTTKYVYTDGTKAADDVVQKVVYLRTATTDINGNTEYTNWTDANGKVDQNDSDTVKTVVLPDPPVQTTSNNLSSKTNVQTKVVTHTTHFVYSNGQKAAEDQVEKEIISRVATTDNNGKVSYSQWEDSKGNLLTEAQTLSTVTTVVIPSDDPVQNKGTKQNHVQVESQKAEVLPQTGQENEALLTLIGSSTLLLTLTFVVAVKRRKN
ncbi:MAG: LPXTG cell wall anchor domain-containing protein, partial [Lactobacillaceae bacterium]|nr:LPXTG cell wall anchor domain-containing protein [Lactobacillaceae bacterium]